MIQCSVTKGQKLTACKGMLIIKRATNWADPGLFGDIA